MIESRICGSPSTAPTSSMQCCDRQLVCWGSILQACVTVLCVMDPLEAPCSVSACKLRDISRSLPWLVVLLPIILLMALWALARIWVISYLLDCSVVVLSK